MRRYELPDGNGGWFPMNLLPDATKLKAVLDARGRVEGEHYRLIDPEAKPQPARKVRAPRAKKAAQPAVEATGEGK